MILKNSPFLDRAYLVDKFINFEDANISIATHALHYGTAAFGGMRAQVRVVDGKKFVYLFCLDKHSERLADSAKMLFCKDDQFGKEAIKKLIIDFVKENVQVEKDFYIRPLIYTSQLALVPTLGVEKSLMIYGMELGDYLSSSGISVTVSSFRRQEDVMIPGRGKISGSYYISSAAKEEAKLRGFDDAILLTNDGKVSEGSSMNIFMVRDGVLITPPVTENILEGITRSAVITLAKESGIVVVERQIDLSELMYKADEVFFTGTAARITSCNKIEHSNIGKEGKITKLLQQAFADVFEGKDKFSWVTKIEL